MCRDFAHLAIAPLRCLNIPARYCTGYISDIGLPPPYDPQDFAAWIEVFLGAVSSSCSTRATTIAAWEEFLSPEGAMPQISL